MSARDAIRFCLRPEHLRRTIRIAIVVGTILLVINESDVFLSGNETAFTWVKCGLNYCVPFVVSNLGLLTGQRARLGTGSAG